MTIRASASHITCVPRFVRFIFCDRRRSMCRRLALLKRTLPLAVILNRFLALLLFLSLGISIFLILQIVIGPGRHTHSHPILLASAAYSPMVLHMQGPRRATNGE